jgi:hypothetical protein
MPRPHEDLERHTAVDHRTGGELITFSPGAWCAIDVAHVAAGRVDAAISTYETLIEKARTSSAKAHQAAVLRSVNGRRVVAMLALDGHEGFRHVKAAWDDHHLVAEKHAVSESHSLALYRLAASAGNAFIDPATKDSYTFEHVARDPGRLQGLVAPISAAPGFLGVLIFGTDDATASVVVSRFEHAAEIGTFRATSAAVDILGPAGAAGESAFAFHPVKTFGAGVY